MTQKKRTKRENWARDVLAAVARRSAALRNPVGSGLVVVRCEKCKTAIATTKVDQAKGEPPILLEFPENARGWTCTRCPPPLGVEVKP